MKIFATLLITFAFSVLSIDQLVATEIILDQASQEIFPESWRGGKISAKAEKLSDSQSERLRTIAQRALAKYPPAFLDSTLTKFYGLGHLEFRGITTGGTRSASSIYIVCKPHFSDAAIERNIHAEYSSVLLRKFNEHFDSEAWTRHNPDGFVYLGSGSAAVREGKASGQFDSALHEQGFLTEYAKASVEEDFNSHVARLFAGDKKYWQAVEVNPRLKTKSEMAISFYNHLDAAFTPAYFRQFR